MSALKLRRRRASGPTALRRPKACRAARFIITNEEPDASTVFREPIRRQKEVLTDFLVSSKNTFALSGMFRSCWVAVPAPLIPLQV